MSWWKWEAIPARVFLRLDDVSDMGALLFGTPNDVRFPSTVYQLDYGDCDRLYHIPSRWTTPQHDCGHPYSVKQFKFVTLEFDDYDGGTTVAWSVDNGARSGSFVAKVQSDNVWGDTGDNKRKMWNDAAGTAVNGLFWGERKSRPMTFRLPQAAWGKLIQLTFSTETSVGAPMRLLAYTIGFTLKRQLYPGKAEA